MLFFQWMENWRAYFIAVCLPPICALFVHIHPLYQRHKENPNMKKRCAQYDFAPFAVGLCLQFDVVQRRKTKPLECRARFQARRVYVLNEERCKWQLFWFAFSLESLSLCCIRYFLHFFYSKRVSFWYITWLKSILANNNHGT